MDTALAKALGLAVRAAREARGFTQAGAAEALGISSEFYGRIERGNTLPSMETAAKLVVTLGVSLDAVAQGLKVPYARQPARARVLVTRIERLLPRLGDRALRGLELLVSGLPKGK